MPANFPSGKLKFDNFSLRYRKDLPCALNGIGSNLIIEPGTKVGVVGRTGAGKSSLVTALFRMVEREPNGGTLEMDGIDIGPSSRPRCYWLEAGLTKGCAGFVPGSTVHCSENSSGSMPKEHACMKEISDCRIEISGDV